ncbi:MAG: GNAT family N-acetyltransferase [Oscillospiraceae bacterium]|jgi:GNAT superfamily N-acetyltransferase|nr:GNAT family N-acetyltransferase [Oscillospiraceae bacterium]
MNHRIIRLSPADYRKCADIWDMDRHPAQAQKWYDEIVSGNRVVFVYTENGAFLGECALVFDTGDPDYTIAGQRIYLSRMIVAREHRNRGIGGILLDYALDQARISGFIEVSLGVDKVNAAAHRLYAKNGFDTVIFDGADEQGEYVKMLKRL